MSDKQMSAVVEIQAHVKADLRVSLGDDTKVLLLFYQAYRGLKDYPCNRGLNEFVKEVESELLRRGAFVGR